MAAHGRLSLGSFGATVFVVVPVILVVACGSRGPLDDDGPLVSTETDAAGTGDGASTSDADDSDAGRDATSARDGRADAGSEGGSVVECGSCVIGSCGSSILMCLEDSGCRTTLQCVATTCLSGGSPDLSCVAGCAAGDLSGALQIFQIFQCVTGTCGSDCGSVLGGLLGGLGGK